MSEAQVIAAAGSSLLVYDRSGHDHADWARKHGVPLVDAARSALKRAETAAAEAERLRREIDEHPVHEACPKCRRTRDLLEVRVKKAEADAARLRADGCAGFDLRRFSEINRRRCRHWMGEKDTLHHHLLGLAGEVGELCNAAKKADRAGRPGTAAPDIDSIAGEIADVFIYLDLVAMHYGVDLAGAVVAKFNATSEKWGFEERLAALAALDAKGTP